jgi:non-specific serine/threonine protein kinase
MRPIDEPPDVHGYAARPRWSEVLRALREARGVTQEGWAAHLCVSRKTVLRWEAGERVPDAGAEAAILAYCRERNLFRAYDRGPLAGLTVTAELLQELIAEARWRVSGRPADDGSPGDSATMSQPDGTPLPEAHPPLSNLPTRLTSFVGRERELAAVRRIQAQTRLLTLTGAGGCGKTRLALEMARELLWAYPHGVWFVDLAPLADPSLLPQVVAATLAIRPTSQQSPTDAAIDALRTRHLLLLLDNCEHLLPACAGLVETLLHACPHLSVVATSRESLGIGGETVWRVPPMSVPGAAFQVPRPESVAVPNGNTVEPGTRHLEREQPDAFRLFVERARLQRPELALSPGDAAAVADICWRLDGMPLAIELAAARVNVLSVGQIAARLSDRFRLLTSGGHTALARHQTLRAAMDWSHDLLDAPERAVLRALSVFSGGFTLEAAEAVCGDLTRVADAPAAPHPSQGRGGPLRPRVSEPPPIPAREGGPGGLGVLDLLSRLVDKSLVIAEERGEEVRYRMLETVRQYAAEQLDAAGEARATRQRQAAWCLAMAEAAWPHRQGPEQGMWLARLTIEHDNLRAALGWCLTDEGDAVLGLRLAGLVWWFWWVGGYLGEGRRWLEALLMRGDDAPPDLRARALNGAGVLAREQANNDEAVRLIEQGLALRRALGDEADIAASLNSLGTVVEGRGEYDRARALYEEALAMQRTLGNRHAVAAALTNLGTVARRQGELDRAVALTEEGVAVLRQVGDTYSVATALQNLGSIHRDQGALERAAARYRESLALYIEVQDRLVATRCVEGLGMVAALRGDAARAARLCGAAAARRAELGAPLRAAGRAAVERTTATARAALGEAAFAAAWAAGEGLSLEEAIADALTDVPPV